MLTPGYNSLKGLARNGQSGAGHCYPLADSLAELHADLTRALSIRMLIHSILCRAAGLADVIPIGRAGIRGGALQ